MTNKKRPPPNHAQIHLPVLQPEEALRFVALLERISAAIWKAHGQQMGECLIDAHTAGDEPLREYLQLSADDDLPF